MAKQIKFLIKAVKATFNGPFVSVSLSDMVSGNELVKVAFSGTLDEAVAERSRLAKHLNVPAAWFLEREDRKARKPAGFDAKSRALHFNPATDGAQANAE